MFAEFGLLVLVVVSACSAPAPSQTQAADTARVRKELERRYEENVDGFLRHEIKAVLALRAPNFHAISPDGAVRDYAEMANYSEGIMNGVKKWNKLSQTIDSLRVVGDTAFAIVLQHADRMALRSDNNVHHVETWVTQRETWIRIGGKWLLWRVDQVGNQRRLIDGQPG